MTDPDQTYGLLLAFDSDSPEFIRGFEAGRVWAILDDVDTEDLTFHLHATNIEMAVRIGEARGYTCRLIAETDDWIEVQYTEEKS